jgi:hypothetical protein
MSERCLWNLVIAIVAAIPIYYSVGNFFALFQMLDHWLHHVAGIS